MENASRTPARVFHFQMGGAMKTILVSLLTLSALPAPAAAADKTEINGTWSGNWTPKGGVPDAVTVELRRDMGGNLTGKFLTPAPMEFSKASFNPLTVSSHLKRRMKNPPSITSSTAR